MHKDFLDRIGRRAFILSAIVEKTGVAVAPAAYQQWRSRGIPHRWRPVVADIARNQQVEIPDGFLGIKGEHQ